ncbi:MAG: trimethylamine methyltransferase family protein [Saccharofermentanales bacterium]
MNLMTGAEVLNGNEIGQLIHAACRILEKTGVEVENEGIIRKLSDFGGTADFLNNRIRFKESFVEDFIRDSKKTNWEKRPVSFSTFVEIYQGYLLDPEDNLYKEWTEQRLVDYIRLSRALPNVGGALMLGCPLKEVPVLMQPLYEKLYVWKYGISGGSAIWNTDMCGRIYEMWQVYAASIGKPASEIFNGTVYMISPLRFGSVEAGQFMWFYERGLKINVGMLGSLGGTAPVTLAGALALQLAENLFLNILSRAFFGSQDLNLGNSISVMDMQNGAFQYGRPEQTILSLAGAQIARALSANYSGHGGLTDAKSPSQEAGVQKASSAIMNALSYGHGNISAGLLGVDEVFSPIQMIFDDEITGSLLRICKSFEVNEETLALDIIDEVGPGGNFLDTDHTAFHFRGSLWQPSVWSREMYSSWTQTGKENDTGKALEKYRSIMKDSGGLVPQITEETERALMKIIKS